jgi:hypothetical protein
MIQLHMMSFERAARAIHSFRRPAELGIGLIVAAWLVFAQPGMSYYGLIDPKVHAQIDAELYGQRPDGETLPGHEQHPPHEHPITPGNSVPALTLVNPFDAAFYSALLSPAQRLALLGQRVEMIVIAQAIVIEPPDQPPRLIA